MQTALGIKSPFYSIHCVFFILFLAYGILFYYLVIKYRFKLWFDAVGECRNSKLTHPEAAAVMNRSLLSLL